MNMSQVISLLPFLLPLAGAMTVLVLGGLKVKGKWLFTTTLLTLVAGAGTICPHFLTGAGGLAPFLTIDGFALFFIALLYAITFIVTLMSSERVNDQGVEVFYAMLLFALVGMSVVVCTTHLLAFVLGLEIYSACFYILIGGDRSSTNTEAAIKYLILAAISSTFLFLGIAVLYFELGHLEFTALALDMVNPHRSGGTDLWLLGTALLFIGAGFKLSLVPFHMWAPDIYQGAPTSISAFLSSASKAAIVAILIRYFSIFYQAEIFGSLLVGIVVSSVIVGNLLALFQKDLKRLLAYSSIAHMGYALSPLCIGGPQAWPATMIYLVSYVVTVLAAFALIAASEKQNGSSLENYGRLKIQNPARALGMALAFFSLAGIPMTAGFIGKWSIFQVIISAENIVLAGAVILGAGLGAFYYLRVVATLYFGKANDEARRFERPLPISLRIAIAATTIGIFFIGLYPEPLISSVRRLNEDINFSVRPPSMLTQKELLEPPEGTH
jgi:NADH-quinone oxidoreductase subunit N